MEGEKMKKKDFYLVESDSDIGKKKRKKISQHYSYK